MNREIYGRQIGRQPIETLHMPKVAKELGALAVSKLTHPNPTGNQPIVRPVGGVAGLMIRITPSGSKSWVLRTVVGGKRRSIGLGSYPEISLATARQRAAEAKSSVREGIDPIEQRRAARAALVAARQRDMTFTEAWKRYWPIKAAEITDQERWKSSIERAVIPIIGNMRVSDITLSDMLRLLKQPYVNDKTKAEGEFWTIATDTAGRVRGRIEEILDWATVNGHRTGDNPARWKGNLAMTLPSPEKITRTDHYPAVSLSDAPAWFAQISKLTSVSALAVQFVVLTAARSGDVRGATPSEIKSESKLWVVPAERMKIEDNGDHTVPLTERAINLLSKLDLSKEYIFAAKRGGALSDMALLMVMRGLHETEIKAGRKGWLDEKTGKPAVVHGLRSTFKDWAMERTDYPDEMSEIALAHKVGDEVRQAYRRGKMIEKRRQMMRDWEAFLLGQG